MKVEIRRDKRGPVLIIDDHEICQWPGTAHEGNANYCKEVMKVATSVPRGTLDKGSSEKTTYSMIFGLTLLIASMLRIIIYVEIVTASILVALLIPMFFFAWRSGYYDSKNLENNE